MAAHPRLAATLTAGLLAVLPLPAQALERLYINGSILTMAGDRPTYVDALGVENGRIVFAGPRGQALARKTANTPGPPKSLSGASLPAQAAWDSVDGNGCLPCPLPPASAKR